MKTDAAADTEVIEDAVDVAIGDGATVEVDIDVVLDIDVVVDVKGAVEMALTVWLASGTARRKYAW